MLAIDATSKIEKTLHSITRLLFVFGFIILLFRTYKLIVHIVVQGMQRPSPFFWLNP
jgi:hypothetical protein